MASAEENIGNIIVACVLHSFKARGALKSTSYLPGDPVTPFVTYYRSH